MNPAAFAASCSRWFAWALYGSVSSTFSAMFMAAIGSFLRSDPPFIEVIDTPERKLFLPFVEAISAFRMIFRPSRNSGASFNTAWSRVTAY